MKIEIKIKKKKNDLPQTKNLELESIRIEVKSHTLE